MICSQPGPARTVTVPLPQPPPLPNPPCYLGKGLREPCSPYRKLYVFGAPFGSFDPNIFASGVNCRLEIIEPTTLFDLSKISKNSEVVLAYYVAERVYSSRTIEFKWYRKRDNKLLFRFKYNIPDPRPGYYWSWYGVFSYIGYCSWEINENGYYYVTITDSAKGTVCTIEFLVVGIS